MVTTPIDAFIGAFTHQPWTADAACRGMTDLFFPDRHDPGNTAAQAKAVCATCPVFTQCAQAGTNERFGIWAGRSGKQRPRRGRGDVAS